MIEVIAVCEGRTEEAFVKEVLQPELSPKAIHLHPRLISTSPRAKGDALSTDRVVHYLVCTLKQRTDTYVTTLFDLHGLPTDFPGWTAADTDPLARCKKIEAALHKRVVDAAQCRADRFVPHIQPHEFEALLFSDTAAFGRYKGEWQSQEAQLAAIADAAESPEHINGDQNTHPSTRIKGVLRSYRKIADGVSLARHIGIERMRDKCQHFREWFDRMAILPPMQGQN